MQLPAALTMISRGGRHEKERSTVSLRVPSGEAFTVWSCRQESLEVGMVFW
jgi:hypothetical protein